MSMISTVMHTGSNAQGDFVSLNCETPQLVQRAWKTELHLTKAQESKCRQICGASRFVYNWALSERNKNWEERKAAEACGGEVPKILTRFDQSNALTVLQGHEETSWLKEIPRTPKDAAIEDLDLAFKHFFRRVKNGETPGYPRFKSFRDSKQSFRMRGKIETTPGYVRLPVLGLMKLKEDDYFPTLSSHETNTATISLYAGKWYISVQAGIPEIDTNLENGGGHAILRFDLPGTMTVESDTGVETIKAPEPLQEEIRKLKRMSRIISRRLYDRETKKESNRRKDARLRFQKFHAKVARRRADYIHKLSSSLVCKYGSFTVFKPSIKEVLEDVPEGDGLPIADAGWGEFLRQLKYKTEWVGGSFTLIEPPKRK